jgi:hypothetical protein
MPRWKARVRIKHLLTEDEDHETTQANMNAIADILEQSAPFSDFDCSQFREIPEGDSFFGPVDYANKLLDQMYDYADCRRIWIE